MRAIAARGLAHPLTLALLAAAATAAAKAWDAGHRVNDTHPALTSMREALPLIPNQRLGRRS